MREKINYNKVVSIYAINIMTKNQAKINLGGFLMTIHIAKGAGKS